MERKKGLIDTSMFMQYCQLGYFKQEGIARAIRTTVKMITDNLLKLDCAGIVL